MQIASAAFIGIIIFPVMHVKMSAQFALRISCFASSHKSPEMALLKHSSEGKW